MFKSNFNSKAKQKQPETTMDEQQQQQQHTLSLILHGCKLAKELEASLGDLANQPEMLSKSCDDIINIFATAKEMLNNACRDPVLFTHHHLLQGSSSQQMQTDPSLQERLKYGVIAQSMDMIRSERTGISIGGETQGMHVSDSSKRSSSSPQRSHRSSRKDDVEKCRMRVAAPQMGNTDVPPEDNYTWRKYGQKEILGSRYPRAYYRCTHQKMYDCPAKKQVQRLDNDFHTFEVTYIGQHTCHMSSTAPSIPPPPQPPFIQDQKVMTQSMVSQPTMPSSSSWLSMEFSLHSGSGSSSGGRHSGNVGGSVTGSRHGRDVVEYPAVTDLVDAMFNTGSSSSNNMDFIFPSVEDKWDAGAGDKKN